MAQENARRLNHNYVGTEHLLLGLIHERESAAAQALRNLGISLEAVHQQVVEVIGLGQVAPSGHIPLTPRVRKVLDLSFQESLRLGHDDIGPEHILLGVIREGEGVAAQIVATRLGTPLDRVRQEVISILVGLAPAPKPAPPPTPRLNRFARNLSQAAATGALDPVVGRTREIERLTHILARRQRNVPLLVGEPGVGKTSIVTGLVHAIAAETVPAAFARRAVHSLDLGSVFTNPQNHGRFAELMTGLLTEIKHSDDLVLFLDNALTVLHTQEGRGEALAFLRSVLGQPGVHVIAACTTAEYRRRTPDPGLDKLLQPLEIGEPPVEDVLEILRVVRPRLEKHHGVTIVDAALSTAAALARDNLPGQAMPGAAIDLLDEASAQAGARDADRQPDPVVDEYEKRIAERQEDRASALAGQDVELAARHDGEVAQLIAALAERRLQTGGAGAPGRRVDEADVVNALAVHSGLPPTPPDEAHDRPSRPGTGTTVPRPTVPHDPSVWAMS
ncbi:Clp protease N-terminal domain-containing protein [Kitasatospora sp. NPDC050463]|uniref:Clp protease N-terminal domain-containing protein n=1 Tax=Kitasatospora sp. NPDC050463 TaxID=3155786 RepID=UPI0033F42449